MQSSIQGVFVLYLSVEPQISICRIINTYLSNHKYLSIDNLGVSNRSCNSSGDVTKTDRLFLADRGCVAEGLPKENQGD